jgi:DNA-binding MarR family transcriptional regulator
VLTERQIVQNCACHRVRVAARAITRTYDDALRPAGLRATQFSVLVATGVDGAISITSLAEHMGMDRSTLTRNVRPLQRAGLISLGPEGWRRSRSVEITSKGRESIRKALPLWQRAHDGLKRRLGAAEWNGLRSRLDRLIAAL